MKPPSYKWPDIGHASSVWEVVSIAAALHEGSRRWDSCFPGPVFQESPPETTEQETGNSVLGQPPHPGIVWRGSVAPLLFGLQIRVQGALREADCRTIVAKARSNLRINWGIFSLMVKNLALESRLHRSPVVAFGQHTYYP